MQLPGYCGGRGAGGAGGAGGRGGAGGCPGGSGLGNSDVCTESFGTPEDEIAFTSMSASAWKDSPRTSIEAIASLIFKFSETIVAPTPCGSRSVNSRTARRLPLAVMTCPS
ncbi:hypothetical protein DOE51_04950 [Bdellovibrio sp. NC01]|nr:hypothetical protein DOE51_04950 [Bdellovibrio sp. NC01]